MVSPEGSFPGATESVGDAGEEDSDGSKEVSTARLGGGWIMGGATGGSNEAEGNWARVLRDSLKSDNTSSLRVSREGSEMNSAVSVLSGEAVSATTPIMENEFFMT